MKALCFGSLNIDYTYTVPHFVRKGETLDSIAMNVFCGGKGLNQSIALARGGAEVYHAGSVGKDGMFLLRQLENAGVCTKYIRILNDKMTGHAMIQNDAEGDNCILLYGGANKAITRTQIDETLLHFAYGDWLILQNEINEIPYLIERGHSAGMVIALTPAPMQEAVQSYPLKLVDYLLLNRVEAQQLLSKSGHTDREELARLLARRFEQTTIVLTLGDEGAMYIHGEHILYQPACHTQVVDTTAAGDTFTGFFLAATMNGNPVSRSLELATQAAGISISRHGASPSIPSMEEVLQNLTTPA